MHNNKLQYHYNIIVVCFQFPLSEVINMSSNNVVSYDILQPARD